MAELDTQLQRAAEIAWQGGLRGRTLERSSLLYPVTELFAKLNQAGRQPDLEVLRAAATQDIFDHLYRIADERYKPGRKKRDAVKAFVDIWFDEILKGVYGDSLRKLLADEKLLRSAFLFHVREQISRGDTTANGEDSE